jgi:hypothetical protein
LAVPKQGSPNVSLFAATEHDGLPIQAVDITEALFVELHVPEAYEPQEPLGLP